MDFQDAEVFACYSKLNSVYFTFRRNDILPEKCYDCMAALLSDSCALLWSWQFKGMMLLLYVVCGMHGFAISVTELMFAIASECLEWH